MNKLNHHRHWNMAIALVTEITGNQQAEKRPQTFATTIHNVVADSRNHHDIRLQVFMNAGIDPNHLEFAEADCPVQRVIITVLHGGCIVNRTADASSFIVS